MKFPRGTAARDENRIQMLNSGFLIHLPKPVTPKELVAVVANLAEQSEG